jgi:hypothetical protein
MAAQLAVRVFDEIPGGGRREAFKLRLVSDRVTVRALIEQRVRHEVEEYNQKTPEYFHGLVQPMDAERVLNGWRLRKARHLDADQQVASALQAFQKGRILLLVDDQQVEALDDEVTLSRDAEVCFFKLVPLIGG